MKKSQKSKTVAFCLDANDFHGVDWVLKIGELNPKFKIIIVSDTFDKKNIKKIKRQRFFLRSLHSPKMYNKNLYSKFGNIWRNGIKLLFSPFFSFQIRKIARNKKILFHAHSMYYIFICAMANVRFIATPMGSDVLIRPDRSLIYKIFCSISLKKATKITVDSKALYNKIYSLTKKRAMIIQNGISVTETKKFRKSKKPKSFLISPRAIDTNYRVKDIVEAKNKSCVKDPLVLFYPFCNKQYFESFKNILTKNDINLGRISKSKMYSLYERGLAVFSIPESDSSPRSVYEAIFCGAPVCTVSSLWVYDLPICMRKRVVLCDLNNPYWMANAIKKAERISEKPFVPTKKAIETFDEDLAMSFVIKHIYEKH